MKLQIKGNLVELQRTIEEFTKSKEAELKSRAHRSTVISHVLFSASLLVLITAIILCFVSHKSSETVTSFLVLTFLTALLYTLFTKENKKKNKIDVDAETKQAVCDMYGNRAFLLDSYHLGRIISVVVESLSISHGRAEICLLFRCQNDSKEVEMYTFEIPLTQTSDINCKGTLTVDLEYGSGTCYYKDIQSLTVITKNNEEFEIIKQFC